MKHRVVHLKHGRCLYTFNIRGDNKLWAIGVERLDRTDSSKHKT